METREKKSCVSFSVERLEKADDEEKVKRITSSHSKTVPFFPKGSNVCKEICNVMLFPFIVLFIIMIQLPVLCFGRRSKDEDENEDENKGDSRRRNDEDEGTDLYTTTDTENMSTKNRPIKLHPLRIDLSRYRLEDLRDEISSVSTVVPPAAVVDDERGDTKRIDEDENRMRGYAPPSTVVSVSTLPSSMREEEEKSADELRDIIRQAMESARPIVLVNGPSAWTDWFRSVSNGDKVDTWGHMPVVPERKGTNMLVISAHYFHANIVRQMISNLARGFCCGGGRFLPSIVLLIVYFFLAVVISVTLDGDSPTREIRIASLFFLILFFMMTLLSVFTRDDNGWRRLRSACSCASSASATRSCSNRGSSFFFGPSSETLLGPIQRFINRVIERDVMYVARFQGYYKAGFAHIDSFASYNFYLVLRGRKRVQLGTRSECARLKCLTRGVDSCFVPDSENDNEAWTGKYFKRMYDFELGPGDILLFHNSAVVHKFRNLLPPDDEDGQKRKTCGTVPDVVPPTKESRDGYGGIQRREGPRRLRPAAFADVYSIRLCWDKDIHPMTLRNDIFTPHRPLWSIKKHLHMGRMALTRNIVRITEDI
eukprot:g1124.t1